MLKYWFFKTIPFELRPEFITAAILLAFSVTK